MSSGRTHDRITLWALPLVVLVALRVTLSGWLTAVVCLGFMLGGWMLGPDLDIHSVQYKRWGWFRWIWLPYRGRIRHRSHWSHGPIIGTVVRVLYLSFWLSLGGLILVDFLNSSQRTALSWGDLVDGLNWALLTYWPWWLALVIGLELGALSHYVADWLSSATKRKRGKGQRKPRLKRRSARRR
ncbi:metal-binding protein [filamentous cyanobacterium CCP3]|nr:metal-binding protein [filamentous cyanobacterium CCP3]